MLSASQIQTIIDVMKPYHPKKIGIFGSMARNEETPNSDIDILYQFHEPISLFEKADIKAILERKLNREVDLVSEKFMNAIFRSHITTDIKIIYGG
ncbi:nucleotidyltransferase family protein [Flavobacterium sp. RHBU_24]|uniref:nucleotidyltransferase family protein n=1 Tax=Flavobacterium sp. RHBU_24 TaxID=3391185 RepID=UPI003984C999